MKNACLKGLLCLAVVAGGLGLSVPPTQAENGPDVVAQSVKILFDDVQNMLGQEKVHSQFDMLHRLKDFGVTYQPGLVAPNGLTSRLIDEDKRVYSGIKLFDAIYAATFLKRQEVSDTVQVIEEIQTALDIRSHADLSGTFFKTLKQSAAEPDSVDVQVLMDQLAKDYVGDVPALLSSEETGKYLIEGLYGFTLEISYVLIHFLGHSPDSRLRDGILETIDTNWLYAILDIFDAYNRTYEGEWAAAEAEERLTLIRQMLSHIEAERAGEITPEEHTKIWAAMARKVDSIRSVILSGTSAP